MGFFSWTDDKLKHGGQLGLDFLGLFPGVNTVTEGLQAAYHLAHAGSDLLDGDYSDAAGEFGWGTFHSAMCALNAVSGEGGEAVELALDGAKAADGTGAAVEATHAAGEAAHTAHAAGAAHGLSDGQEVLKTAAEMNHISYGAVETIAAYGEDAEREESSDLVPGSAQVCLPDLPVDQSETQAFSPDLAEKLNLFSREEPPQRMSGPDKPLKRHSRLPYRE